MADDTNGLSPQDREAWMTAFVAVLPEAIKAQGWTLDGKSITSGEMRVKLAAIWADYAVDEIRSRFGTDDADDVAGE